MWDDADWGAIQITSRSNEISAAQCTVQFVEMSQIHRIGSFFEDFIKDVIYSDFGT